MTSALLAQAVDPEALRRLDACGTDPGAACRWVVDTTNSVGLAKVADWLTGTSELPPKSTFVTSVPLHRLLPTMATE